jgi:tetratricopeptide (TPR) repeat protein
METVLVRSLNRNAEHDRDIYKEIADVDSELLTIDPFVPFARKNLASAYYSLGQFDHALLELQKAIEYEPNYVPGYLQMSEWYTERGDAVAGQRYMAAAMNIISRYRNSNRSEPYEGILLGRPLESWAPWPGQAVKRVLAALAAGACF